MPKICYPCSNPMPLLNRWDGDGPEIRVDSGCLRKNKKVNKQALEIGWGGNVGKKEVRLGDGVDRGASG